MTISSAMNAGVAGLNANAARLAGISDNIANASTYGYKRLDTEFASMVINGDVGGGKYSAGGVRASTYRLIDEGGALVGTSNSLDLAISGRGFLPVTRKPDTDAGVEMIMTRSGAFRPDKDGVVRTNQGLVLLGWPANTDGTVPAMPRDSTSGLEPVVINMDKPMGSASTAVTLGANLPATATMAGASGDALPLSVEYYGNLGTSESLDFVFTPTVPPSGATNEWTVEITDSASGGAVIGEYVLTFDDTRPGAGTLLSVTTISGGAYDASTGEISLTVGGGPLTLDIGAIGAGDGLMQLAGAFAPTGISRDGAPISQIAALEIDDGGFLVATYASGLSQRLYQIPVVDVPNPNGLTSLDDQTFRVSNNSGGFFLWDANTGPVGTIEGNVRESSTTDVAAELTSLIQTQRAYSSNAKVIQTVDEMLQETTNLKR